MNARRRGNTSRPGIFRIARINEILCGVAAAGNRRRTQARQIPGKQTGTNLRGRRWTFSYARKRAKERYHDHRYCSRLLRRRRRLPQTNRRLRRQPDLARLSRSRQALTGAPSPPRSAEALTKARVQPHCRCRKRHVVHAPRASDPGRGFSDRQILTLLRRPKPLRPSERPARLDGRRERSVVEIVEFAAHRNPVGEA